MNVYIWWSYGRKLFSNESQVMKSSHESNNQPCSARQNINKTIAPYGIPDKAKISCRLLINGISLSIPGLPDIFS